MLNLDFKEFAELLRAHGVEYLLVGGYALAAFGFGSLGLRPEDFGGDSVIELGRPPNRIDLLTRIDGVDFAPCWPRRLRVTLDGTELQLIGLEDFKTNKRASGRLKDLADLEALEPPQES